MNFSQLLCFITSLLLTVPSCVQAQGGKLVDWQNHFIWPPLPGQPSNVDPDVYKSNPVFEVGKTLDRAFTWVSNVKNMKMYMLQEGAPNSGAAAQYLLRACGGNYANNATNLQYWDGRIGTIDISVSNVVFLGAYDCDVADSAPVFFSHYFNLTRSTKSTATITIQTSSTLLPAPTSVAATQAPGTVTPVGSSMESETMLDSSVVIMAGGIGGGIGGAILIVAAVFGFLKYRSAKKKQQRLQLDTTDHIHDHRPRPEFGRAYEQSEYRSPPRYEVAGNGRHETESVYYKHHDLRFNSPPPPAPPQQMEAPVEMYSGAWGRHNAVEM